MKEVFWLLVTALFIAGVFSYFQGVTIQDDINRHNNQVLHSLQQLDRGK